MIFIIGGAGLFLILPTITLIITTMLCNECPCSPSLFNFLKCLRKCLRKGVVSFFFKSAMNWKQLLAQHTIVAFQL